MSLVWLTTAVGGLGFNLTAAHMVMSLEHNWNPMKDLQANLWVCKSRVVFLSMPEHP